MTQPAPGSVTIVDPARDLVTLVNVFTVKPENQQPFVEAQTGEFKRLSGKIAGSVSANLHRGLGGTRVVNYAQLRSLEDFRAWQQSDLMKEHLPVIRPYIERAQPAVYRAVAMAARDGRPARIEESSTSLIAVLVVEPGAIDEVIAAQREAASRLVAELPGLRWLAIHRGIATPAGPARPGQPDHASPGVAVYAQLDGEAAGRALLEHPVYRAAFVDEPRVKVYDAELYAVLRVQNEAAVQAAAAAARR